MRSSFLVPFSLLVLLDGISATRLALQGRASPELPALLRRGMLSGQVTSLNDSGNINHYANISLNGKTYETAIDTGSSDLFVTSAVPNATDEHYNATISYASGGATGEVKAATLEFAGFEIPDQFYTQNISSGFAGTGGLIGLGPSQGSVVRLEGNSSAADTPLDRIFRQNTSTPNYLSVLLGRSDDPDDPYPGDLTIGEPLQNYTDILKQPRLNVTVSSVNEFQHWQTLLDKNGIIGPDGKAIPITSQVNHSIDPSRATVIFDTGFTLPQVPGYVAKAIYGGVNGSYLYNISGIGEIWILPCNEEVNATFLFAGVQYPIHPLDLNFGKGELTGVVPNGAEMCVGAFQPFSFDPRINDEVIYDMILGMAFLRNAYLLVDLGDFIDGSNSTTAAPYIQLLSVTNATEASQEFAQQRQNGTSAGDLNASDALETDSSSLITTHTVTKSTIKMAAWVIAVIVAAVVVAFLLLGICCFCICRKRGKRSKGAATSAWPAAVPVWSAAPPSYRSLQDPLAAPQAHDEMHKNPNSAPAVYAPEQQYNTVWDRHV
ncbi:hypothetical protein SERLA73DRAFT_110062 [Serpula lacrymans var. lacrymans S7.3]|uniref:Peptidase A1 domain-containing protein n=1 Tax=Serpula lacrymans var. lacrymans (strain S7.3) TaxID=936435 RepID=F8Q048_SERL3|nr:hypothetical protein SERLA73DRAFT_110062 [Serpula lacrymans var. lacrymans S7.3]